MTMNDESRSAASQKVPLEHPSRPWRAASTLSMSTVASLSKGFMYGLNTVEVTGLSRLMDILDKRRDVQGRQRGLITVSNHVSVLDDPLMWSVLPLRYFWEPTNFRWGLGAHDILFKNVALGALFSLGQVLPTHRQGYSPHGGAFQPTITQAIRLLSSQPFTPKPAINASVAASDSPEISDPFTTGGLTYSTNGTDRYTAPSVYACNKYAWVHVFPEGCVHQHPDLTVRYFKWGISRLILESEPAPDILPIFIDGTQHVMAEDRAWPRFVPRAGKRFKMAVGELVDVDEAFGDLRSRWRELVERQREEAGGERRLAMGELTDELRNGEEAVGLRIEVAKRVRDEIERLRARLGYPEDDPALGLAETWAKEPRKRDLKSNVDGSLVKKE